MQRGRVTELPGIFKLELLINAGRVSRPTGAMFPCLAAGTGTGHEMAAINSR